MLKQKTITAFDEAAFPEKAAFEYEIWDRAHPCDYPAGKCPEKELFTHNIGYVVRLEEQGSVLVLAAAGQVRNERIYAKDVESGRIKLFPLRRVNETE